ISAYGQEGPYRDWPAFDLALQAMGGAMSVTGEPGGRPVRMGVPMADLAGGLFGAFAVAGALCRRERTGEGGHVDLSLLDCQVSLLTYIAQYFWTNGRVPTPLGSGHASVVPYSALQTRDGHLIVAIFAEKFWGLFCRAVDHPEWERDLRFATNRDRVLHRDVLMPLVEAAFRTRTTTDWLARLQAHNVPGRGTAAVRGAPVNIAVLGGGNGGFATAADLALAGHSVRLWSRSPQALGSLAVDPTIALTAEGRAGKARLARATTELSQAVAGAEILIAPLPATSHDDLAKRLAPHLDSRQIILLTPGTLGTYAMARALGRAGATLPYALAETGSLPYLARKTGSTTVSAPVRAANLPLGVFPASRTAPTIARLAELFPSLRPCADALDAALTNAGPVIHPPLVLLNAGPIDGGRFDVHAAGTTSSVRRLIDAVDAERVVTRKGWGYPAPHYELATYYDETRAAEGLYGAGARAKLIASGLCGELLT